MPDTRFYEALGPVSLAELARLTGARLRGGEGVSVEGAAPLGRAGPTDVSHFSDRRYAAELGGTRAGACFVQERSAGGLPSGCAALMVDAPQMAYARAAALLHAPHRLRGAAAIDPEAELEDGVRLAPGVVIGPGARIGTGTEIGANSVIGPGVCIGRRCRIGPGVSIGFALIGDEVTILAGAAIGEPGFGVATAGGRALDIPQLGRVILQDRVSIGAGTCVDRGAWDDTVVGENTKIDNLVQIAHNVRIGRNCLLAAHVGISGSVVIGDGAVFGGRAGVVDHVEIGAGATISAAAAVMKSVPAGEVWGGAPARPFRRYMRETAWLSLRAGRRRATGEGTADE